MSSIKNNVIVTVIIVVVVAATAFFGGMKYSQSQRLANFSGQFGNRGFGAGQNGQGRSRGGFGGATIGDIISQDANSITVKLMDGSSKIVLLSNSTTYSKTDNGSKSDLKTGTRVAAFGTANSDGSITAQNVQINPMFRTSESASPAASQ